MGLETTMKIATNEAQILMSSGRRMGGNLRISGAASEMMNHSDWKVVRSDGYGLVIRRDCLDCKGVGMRVEHKQGDSVPDHPGYFYTSTLMVTCKCASTVTSETLIPTMPWLGNDSLSYEIRR
jgi:hypothetical protein